MKTNILYYLALCSVAASVCTASPADGLGCLSEYLDTLKNMRAEFTTENAEEPRVVRLTDLDAKLAKGMGNQSDPKVDLYRKILERIGNGDLSAYGDFDYEISYIDEDSKVAVYNARFFRRIAVDKEKFRIVTSHIYPGLAACRTDHRLAT
ncbi:hypothetical protein BH09SUM1_BH09SUM1_25350 [soil metagenome]